MQNAGLLWHVSLLVPPERKGLALDGSHPTMLYGYGGFDISEVPRFRPEVPAILERGGVMEAVERSGSRVNPTRVAGSLVFWFVMFAVMLVAANALGLQSLANVFSELVSYIPSVIAAIVIMIVGIVLGSFVGHGRGVHLSEDLFGGRLPAAEQPDR